MSKSSNRTLPAFGSDIAAARRKQCLREGLHGHRQRAGRAGGWRLAGNTSSLEAVRKKQKWFKDCNMKVFGVILLTCVVRAVL